MAFYCLGHLRGGKFANGKFVNFLILPDISHAFSKKQYRTNYNFDSSHSKKNLATLRIYKFTTDLRICHLLNDPDIHPLIRPDFEIGVTVVPWHCFSWEITPHENDLDNKETFNHLSVYNAWDV